MAKLHWLNASIAIILVIILMQFMSDKYGLLYGAFVSLINLVVSYGYFYWHKQRVVKKIGQSMQFVMNSMIVRVITVVMLLMLGFSLSFDADALITGFVLGQFFYFLNQLIRIVEHGN